MRTARPVVMLIACALVVPATSVAVAEDGPAPTKVLEANASAGGGSLSVDGVVDWGGQAPVVLGTDPAGDPPAGVSGRGLDVTSIAAWVEDGDVPVATFAWRVTQLDEMPPPETARYYWQFAVNGAPYALQAKTTDFASGANLSGTPEGLASNLASYGQHLASTGTLPQFRIRGNCETIVAISNCGHVAWADGEFDLDANEIRFHLPLDSDATAPIRPGASVTATDGAWASLQAVADNASTRDTVIQTGTYVIPARTATAIVRDAAGAELTRFNLQVGDEGAVSGTLPAAPAAAAAVSVVACFAGSCGTASATL